jgi:glucose-6-phosphate 1-epimerase
LKGAISESERRLGLPGIAEVLEGNGGMPKVRITSAEAVGEMYLHGAHVTSWRPARGEEMLFLSSRSRWEQGHAIRGGIPICFPWFGAKIDDPKAPAHGFVRTVTWQLESIVLVGEAVMVSMVTESNEATMAWWPAQFRLHYRVTFGSELRLELAVTNTGTTLLRFEEALHTYHRVGNITQARVRGLENVQYLDKTDSNRLKMQRDEIVIESETDRVYLNTIDAIELEDTALGRRTRVTKENSRTTVIWNPWTQKAHSLSDFADDEWRHMFCIETSNVSNFGVDLAPGQHHNLKALVSTVEL